MSVQPQWITPAGSLATWAEKVFYQATLQASAGNQEIFFQLIAGQLPDGVQVTANGILEGVPRNIITVQGVPREVSEDVTSRFAIRAFTRRLVNGQLAVDRIADRTFEITITGQSIPEFLTPPGLVGTFYDGAIVDLGIQFTDSDPDDRVRVSVLFGTLPPGLTLNPSTGRISGIIEPLIGPPGTAQDGYDATAYDQYPFDFATRSQSKNYQFALEISDGKQSNVRTFQIYVYAKDSMSADTIDFTADNTFITADIVPGRTPVLLTQPGDIGRIRADNFFAVKFNAIDFDGDAIEYLTTTGVGAGYDESLYDQDGIGFDRGGFFLPPGLQIDADTGWFYGYIPDQGVTETTYRFAIRVAKVNQPQLISDFYFFTITVIGNIETEIIWLTPPNLGVIDNGAISTLSVAAVNTGGRQLQYRLDPGSSSALPQGLTLQPSGHITGRVSFNTFALDGGTTIFDSVRVTRLGNSEPTTFDLEFAFTVNAFAVQTEQIEYEVNSITVLDGGSGYVSQPTVVISAPADQANGIQATAGVVTIVNGVITAIAVGNPGRGYNTAPTITITGGGGAGATARSIIRQSNLINIVSVLRRFTITVNRRFAEPYESLYIQCMPPLQDRELLDQLVQNQDIIPANLVYRADDPNFGVASRVIYPHAFGLTASTLPQYLEAMTLNHYWKNLTIGSIRTAQARDATGQVIYEVVYSQIIDDLVNAQGQSVGKSVNLPYDVESLDGSTVIGTVYPNSLINMRDQIVDEIGQISPALPSWMTSKQQNGSVLGFQPAWVIAYVKPGESDRVAYNIRTRFGSNLNVIDFKVDRYILDRSQTRNWDSEQDEWVPQPPAATTFDQFARPLTVAQWINRVGALQTWLNNQASVVPWILPELGPQPGTIFDGNGTRFINIADRWVATDEFNKYLLFSKQNILQ